MILVYCAMCGIVKVNHKWYRSVKLKKADHGGNGKDTKEEVYFVRSICPNCERRAN